MIARLVFEVGTPYDVQGSVEQVLARLNQAKAAGVKVLHFVDSQGADILVSVDEVKSVERVGTDHGFSPFR